MDKTAIQGEKTVESTCVYCGTSLEGEAYHVQVKSTDYEVCSAECKAAGEKYLERDKRFKLPLFLVIAAAAVAIILAALSEKNTTGAYIMQILVGLAFVALPYPVMNFSTFKNCSIKRTTLITRIIGAFLAVFGAIVLLGS